MAPRRLRQAARRRWRGCAARVVDGRQPPAGEGRVSDSGRRRTASVAWCSRFSPVHASQKVVLAFEGASGIDPDELDKIVEQQELERQLFTDPLVVTELLERYYREQGYPRRRDRRAALRVPGRDWREWCCRFGRARGSRCGSVTVSGNTVYADRRRRLPASAWSPASRSCRPLPRTRSRRSAISTGRRATTTSGRTTTLVQDRATGQVDVGVHDHRRTSERDRRHHDRRQRQGQQPSGAGADSAGRLPSRST